MENEYILNGPKLRHAISELSVGQQLHQALRGYQNLPAIVEESSNSSVSYKDLLLSSCDLANTLHAHGYSKGTVIGILSENSIHFCVPLLAALYLGCTVTLFSPSYTPGELLHLTGISKPSVIFCSKTALKNLKMGVNVVVIDSNEAIGNIPSLNTYVTKLNSIDINPVEVDSRTDVAFILYSSGTTGLPKGVQLTHRNVSFNIAIFSDPDYYKIPSTTIGVAPFFHIFGLAFLIRNLIFGTRSIIFNKFNELSYLKTIEKYKVARVSVVPTLANLLAHSTLTEKFDLSSVEYIFCGGDILSAEIENLLKLKFVGLKHVQQAYGMTETITLTMPPADDSRAGSCGKLVPNLSAKVVDKNGKVLGANCVGEMCFKGDAIMKGYIGSRKDDIVTPDENGWFLTGDVGYYDKDGYFFLIGRIKELIKYKSYQVAPAELEGMLKTHPDILDAAVIGKPDEVDGELPLAFVVRRLQSTLSEHEVQQFVMDKLSPQKWLRGGVKFIATIPKSLTGKILRKELRKYTESNSKSKL